MKKLVFTTVSLLALITYTKGKDFEFKAIQFNKMPYIITKSSLIKALGSEKLTTLTTNAVFMQTKTRSNPLTTNSSMMDLTISATIAQLSC